MHISEVDEGTEIENDDKVYTIKGKMLQDGKWYLRVKRRGAPEMTLLAGVLGVETDSNPLDVFEDEVEDDEDDADSYSGDDEDEE